MNNQYTFGNIGTNQAIGTNVGSILTGDNNVLFGNDVGNSLSSGNRNTVIGVDSFALAVTTNNCTGVGYNVLNNNTADDNTAIGNLAGLNNTTGASFI